MARLGGNSSQPVLFPESVTPILRLTVNFREACKSILSFLKDCIELSASEHLPPSYRPQVKEALMARGQPMARLLIAACTGGLPESRNYDVRGGHEGWGERWDAKGRGEEEQGKRRGKE